MALNPRIRFVDRKVSPVFVGLAVSFASASTAAKSSSPPLVGLRNLGNTCYLNSQLQSAFHIPHVREIITSPRRSEEEERDDTPVCDEEAKKDSIGLQALRQLFEEMEKSSDSNFPVPVAPVQFCQSLGIPVLEQQDSQEFWKLLLPALEMPPLMDLYQGAYEDYITEVGGSGRERRREEPFLDLSLEVTSGSLVQSLQDMFGTPELLSEKEGNGWRPEEGLPMVDALKGSLLRVAGLPSLLQCHLKRFQYDWQTDCMSKLNDRFTFPKDLDLSCICTDVKEEEEQSTLYDLQAVVVHVGEYGSGHYYAYVRPDIRSEDWYRFNDHEVVPVSYRDVIEDSYGGRVSGPKKNAKQGLFKRMFDSLQSGSNGWGGRTSCAYMLQYVRHADIPKLYLEEQHT